jgi:hypothetical protein
MPARAIATRPSQGLRGLRLLAAMMIAAVGGLGVAWFLQRDIATEIGPGHGVGDDASQLVRIAIALTVVAVLLLPWARWSARAASILLIVIGVGTPGTAGTLSPYVELFPPYGWTANPVMAVGVLSCCFILAFGAPLILGWTSPRASPREEGRADVVLAGIAVVCLVVFGMLTRVSHSAENPGTPGDYALAFVSFFWFGWCAALLTIVGLRIGRRTAPRWSGRAAASPARPTAPRPTVKT